MASDHWSGTFAAARDRTGGDRFMPESNHIGNYDHIRCICCGVPWNEHDDVSLICNRHRPAAAPDWIAEALANHDRFLSAVADAAEKLHRAEAIDRHERARDAIAAVANGEVSRA